jgi:Metallo-peptidase family M12
MTHVRFPLILVAAGIGALIWVWPGPARAQTSACYKACPIPATSVSAPRYVACLGTRIGNKCTVCPGQLTGQSLQIIADKTVRCLKACAKGYVWNAAMQQCCPGQKSNLPATAEADLVELIIAPGTSGGRLRVSNLFRTFAQRVQSRIILRMTHSEKWTVLKRDVEVVKNTAAARGLIVLDLASVGSEIMRTAAADTQFSERQRGVMEGARSAPAATDVKLMVGPHPAVLEYALIGDANCPTEPVKIAVPFGVGTSKTITRSSIEIRGDKAIWRGPVDDTGVPLTIMWWPNGRMAGAVQIGNRLYSIRHLGDSLYALVEMSDERMPSEHAPMPPRLRRSDDPNLRDDPLVQQGDASVIRPPKTATRTPSLRGPDTSTSPRGKSVMKKAEPRLEDIVIDVIVAYTAKAAARYNEIRRDLVELAIERGNESFSMSGLSHIKLRLVHAYQTTYVEEGAHFDHVWRFADKGDGYMEEIHGLRDKFRADVAILIVDDAQGCGLATRVHADADEAFAVVHHDCAALTYTVAHEIGHIIGTRHELSMDKSTTPFPYGHGYVNGTKWRDIMSYKESCGGCPRLPIWSSPKVMVQGEPAGTSDQDNARVILEQAARVAKFR